MFGPMFVPMFVKAAGGGWMTNFRKRVPVLRIRRSRRHLREPSLAATECECQNRDTGTERCGSLAVGQLVFSDDTLDLVRLDAISNPSV